MGVRKENFIGIARTPVTVRASGKEFKLKGFVLANLTGKGAAERDTLLSSTVQISMKWLTEGQNEPPHTHGPQNKEYCFVLEGLLGSESEPWGPININGEGQGVVRPGQFTAIIGDQTVLDWVQAKGVSRVLVIKEPSFPDKKPAVSGGSSKTEPLFLKALGLICSCFLNTPVVLQFLH